MAQANVISPVTYYVKAGGNDALSGLSDANAWGTIAKVNGFTFATGDTIKFKKGDSFYGSIVVPSSNLVFDAYGTGAKPIITGFTTLAGWTSAGGGVWYITVTAVKNTVNMVTLNDAPQEVGRYPNSDATNGGYLTDSSYTGNTQYTCTALNGTNWTGAEVVARLRGYIVERNTITAQTGSTITYAQTIATINPRNAATPAPTTPPAVGFGLFIQRDIRTLDKLGEWFFNTGTKVMSIYFGAANPSSYSVKVSSLDTLMNINTKSNITVNGLDFEGANLAAVYFVDGSNRNITNCTINNSGAKGIFGWASDNTIIDNNTVTNCMTGAIDIRSCCAANVSVTNNIIASTGMLKGMSSFYDPADCNAVYVGLGSTARISLNTIDSTGYTGIHYDGSGVNVDSNFVNHYCQVRNDGGGIYAFHNYASASNIRYNTVLNAGNAILGTQEQAGAHGIYMDGGQGGVNIIGNTISTVYGVDYYASFGLLFNSPKNIVARDNTVYNGNGWYNGRDYNETQSGFSVKHNIFFNTSATQSVMEHTHTGLNTLNAYTASTIQQSLQRLGSVDSNYYNSSNATPFCWYYAQTLGGGFTGFIRNDFATFKSYASQDANSVMSNYSGYQLVTNPSGSAISFSFAGMTKIDVYGNVYYNSATIPAWQSKILIDNGTSGGNFFRRRRRR